MEGSLVFGLFTALFAVGAAIVAGVKRIAHSIRDIFREQVVRTMDKTIDVVLGEIEGNREEIRNLNERVLELEAKSHRDGTLRISEQEELEYLRSERIGKMQKWGQSNVERLALVTSEVARESVLITPDKLHIADGYVGFASLNRKCKVCQRLLTLRRNTQEVRSLSSFFWGCPAFFENETLSHKYSEAFQMSDLSVFVDKSIEDWNVNDDELNAVVELGKRSVQKRVSQVVSHKIDQIICGTHAEPLVLKEKREPTGLLDQYFLRCARPSCEYKVKIASVGQLSTLLAETQGRGLL